jgi:DNA-binding protein YbaB
MTDHREEVAQLLADYRRSREQLATVQRTLLSIAESASSPDGLIRATVDSAGSLTRLTIADDAYRRYRPAELADAVVRATQAAARLAATRAGDALAPVLPPGGDPDAVLAGRADLTPAEIAPVVRPVHDEDSYEETSWLETGR